MAEGAELLFLMRSINRLKKKYLAVLLTDVEREYKWVNEIQKDAEKILKSIEEDSKVDTYRLKLLLEHVNNHLPSYYMTRKIVLDNVNEFVRNIIQALLGDIEN